MARNVIYFNSDDNGTLRDIVSLPYTDVIVCFLLVDSNLNVYGDGAAFDSTLQSNIQKLQNAGKNVLVSFGGDPKTFPSSAWQLCAQNVFAFDPDGQSVLTNNILEFLSLYGFNGIDIDYEDSDGFTGKAGYDGKAFLIALTNKISRFLPNYRNIITHAPQPPYWDPNYYLWASQGTAPYTQIWQQVGDLITWINCQFYDNTGYDDDAPTKVGWYKTIAATTGAQKLLVGALLPNGGTIGSDGIISLDDMAQNVIGPLKNQYGNQFGGVMGWQFAFDQGGSWATGIWQALSGPVPAPPPLPQMANLYAFHQGFGDNGQLWYSVFDGSNWATDTQVPIGGMSSSPSAVAWAGGITVFHQGPGDGQLWYTYSGDGANWGEDTLVQPLGMTDSPSAVAYNGLLYVFHQGFGNNGQLWYSVFDGTNWATDTQIPIEGMSGSPSAVAWAGGITIFHQGPGDGQLWYSYSGDGTNWGGDTLVQPLGMTDSPSAVVLTA